MYVRQAVRRARRNRRAAAAGGDEHPGQFLNADANQAAVVDNFRVTFAIDYNLINNSIDF